MPTQYTPKLRLALPETGELSGTWGNTVNNSITQMIEEAITGRAVITGWVADSYTLSEANGATSEARCVMLDLGGVLTGDGTVLIPDNITKMYIVRNDTIGGFAVTVKMSTGSGVSVPNGQTTIVFSDGTNVIQVGAVVAPDGAMVGNVVGNVVGNLTGDVTGNLVSPAPTAPTQAFGTDDTSVATTAFVQQALQALHPVGSVYINASDSTNPATLFGFGTWVAFGSGRVPVGVDAADPLFDSAEKTGGSKDAVVVSHNHDAGDLTTSSAGSHSHSGTTNSTGAHQHRDPDRVFEGLDAFGNWNSSTGTRPEYGTFTSYVRPLTDSAGNHSHTLSINTSGAHTHNVTGSTASAGVSGENANIQPYITVYMWKRIA